MNMRVCFNDFTSYVSTGRRQIMDSCSILRLVLITMATVPCLFSGHPLSETPLFLTPYIEAGHITEAVEACNVVDPGDNTSIPHSYAGLLTVNKTLGNHLFFWFFPSQEQVTAPLLIWFNGGPGSSSMLGALWENGPIQPLNGAGNTDKFEARHGSWVGPFSMLYIDNPVFAGYSFSDSGPRVTQEEYGEDLFEFVRQFYQLFPHLLSADLYVGGESYAGKYVPVLAHRIHSCCEEGCACFPMKGIYIGGPLFAPELMFPENFEYLYNVGAVSKSQREKCREDTQELIDKYLCGELSPAETIRKIMPIIFEPEIPSYNNYVTGESPDKDTLKLIMTSERMRRALHVGNLDFEMENKTLFDNFHGDIMSNTSDKLGELLDSGKYKVLIYSGDSDVVVSVAMVEAGLLGLKWRGQQAYQVAGRKFWYGPCGPGAPRPLYGYYSLTGELCRVVVRGAGHQTPRDQLDISREMMIQFVNGGCVGGTR